MLTRLSMDDELSYLPAYAQPKAGNQVMNYLANGALGQVKKNPRGHCAQYFELPVGNQIIWSVREPIRVQLGGSLAYAHST